MNIGTWKQTPGLAWRNLWRNRRRTLITVSMIAFGFALAVVSIGLGDGGHNAMIRNAIRMGDGHLTVQPRGYLTSPANYRFLHAGGEVLAQVQGAGLAGRVAPRVSLQLLASSATNAIGVALQGIQPGRDPLHDVLGDSLVDGDWLEPGDHRGLLIGESLSRKLDADVGNKVVLMAGGRDGQTISQLGRVRGIFRTGLDELDGYVLLSDLALARQFLYAEGATPEAAPLTRIAVFLDDAEALPAAKTALADAVTAREAVVLDWQEMMPQLVSFIVVDDVGNYIWLVFILVMVAFGILNTILMSVLERTREFGLLRALGVSPAQLLTLVLLETIQLAIVALVAGWLLALGGHAYFAIKGLDLSAMGEEMLMTSGAMMDPILRTELSAGRVTSLTLLVFVTTLLAGIYPAFRAARVSPVAALHE
jgi:ABC-type lipoprotein release transport system permease subunit